MRRPIQKLFPLEVNDSKTNEDEFAITFVEHAKEENDISHFSLGPVYKFVCILFRTDNLNCFRAS